MTQEEQRRVMVLTAVREGQFTAADAAGLLGLSIRQCRRLLAAFRRRGPGGLAHGNRGRPAPNRVRKALERQVVRLALTAYRGFNQQHFTEMLAERHGLRLSRPTIRRILRAAGLASPRPHRRRRFHRRRERMPHRGMLLQWDGSEHAWLEKRGPRLVLHAAIDDATNEVPAATFRLQEDSHGYLRILRDLVQTCGIPVAVYGDRHGIVTNDARPRLLTLDEQLRGHVRPLTQVGRALHDLGIQWIPAGSPQAKGRIERLFGTFQDRLVSELRHAHTRTLEQANAVLQAFLPRYNAHFTHAPTQAGSAYRPPPSGLNLDDVCCFAFDRTVANDNTLALDGQHFQLLPTAHRASYAKTRVIIHRHLDGRLSITHHGRRIAFRLLTPPSRPAAPSSPLVRRPPPPRAPHPWTPPRTHPWKKTYAQMLRRKELKRAGVTFRLNTKGDRIAEL